MVKWIRDVVADGLRRSIGPTRALRFLRGQARIRFGSLRSEMSGMLLDIRELRRSTRPLLLVGHQHRLGGGIIEAGLQELCTRLVDAGHATVVRSRLGYRIRRREAKAAFSLEPFTSAPPVRFDARHDSAVLVSDTWDKTWMANHLGRCRADWILTPYLWPVMATPALARTGPERWRLFPWWAPDFAVAADPVARQLAPEIVVVGAAGEMYDLRMWVARHPAVAGYFRISNYEEGADRLDARSYFELLNRHSAVVVAFSEHEAMRVPVAKTFEVPAAGSLLIAARAHHLEEIGFRDGINCLIFEGREDFEQRVQPFLEDPASFRDVVRAGWHLVAHRHTTSVRLAALRDMLRF